MTQIENFSVGKRHANGKLYSLSIMLSERKKF